ncbi:MAG: ATP-dependent Clp protease ATP-binding subunit [Clostridia bacterium]|nr:ATP-dependent Clp protease ATP-binding subunit [Clostridia bacterium]
MKKENKIYPQNATEQLKLVIKDAYDLAETTGIQEVPITMLLRGFCKYLPTCYIFNNHNIVDYTVELFMDGEWKEELLDNFGNDISSLNSYLKTVDTVRRDDKALTAVSVCFDLITIIKNTNSILNELFEEKQTSTNEIFEELTYLSRKIDTTKRIGGITGKEVLIEERILDMPNFCYSKKRSNSTRRDNIMRILGKEEYITNNFRTKESDLSELLRFGEDLTILAIDGKIDDVIGREEELERVINILSKRIKNNPVILGKAGVGKTALVEKLAIKIVKGEVPNNLKNHRIISLSVNSMLAGTKYRGDFEERMQNVLKTVEESSDIILFIDEIHMILGAGSSIEGSVNFGNILKPYIARGKVSVIGATTSEEYTKTIEKDSALERRFEPVIVNEPTEEEVLAILRGIVTKYEEYHSVIIEDEMLKAVIALSKKYILDRNFPDKALDVLDASAANAKLEKSYKVRFEHIAKVVSRLKNIPIEEITLKNDNMYNTLIKDITSKLFGQDDAVRAVVKAIMRGKFALDESSHRPVASILLLGKSSVGKTYLSKLLARYMLGSEKNMITLNMSEYAEETSVNKIIGAPPGYVGYSDVNFLVDSIKRNPSSIILFEEVDKAHMKVIDVITKILEEGVITTSYSKNIDFTSSVIILTTSDSLITKEGKSLGFQSDLPKAETLKEEAIKDIKNKGYTSLIERLDEVILMNTLDESALKKIAKYELENAVKFFSKKGYIIAFDEKVKKYVLSSVISKKKSAREIKRFVTKEITDFIISEIMSGNLKENERNIIKLDGKNNLLIGASELYAV